MEGGDTMVRDILIGIHAVAGTAAFVAGIILTARIARAREPRLFGVYLTGLALLAATAAALVGWDWPTFEAAMKVVFAALVVLAAIMLVAGGPAGKPMRRRGPRRGRRSGRVRRLHRHFLFA